MINIKATHWSKDHSLLRYCLPLRDVAAPWPTGWFNTGGVPDKITFTCVLVRTVVLPHQKIYFQCYPGPLEWCERAFRKTELDETFYKATSCTDRVGLKPPDC